MTVTETRFEDRYPTRVSSESTLLERTDPTVWASDADGPMDAASLAAHDAKGFSVIEGLLSPAEVQAYWAELHRLAGDSSLNGDERVVVDPETGEVRSVFGVHEISPLIGELVHDPRVLDRARQVLGSEVYLHQSRVKLVPGFESDGYYWHSDFETWHAEDGMAAPRAVSMSIALTDNYPFNGGMMLMPGSQRTFVSCAGRTPEDDFKVSLQSQNIGVPSALDITKMAAEHGIEQFTGHAGSALLFDCNVMHGSGNNITPYPRSNIYLVFNSVDNELGVPFEASEPRPEYFASRRCTPIQR
jgi:ectoine hydroxylase